VKLSHEADANGRGGWTATSTYALGFLTLIAVFNYLDRGLLGLALPAIKQEWHVSDTLLGLITGPAFAIFYTLVGLPIAWAADRWNRKYIIAIGFAFWSLMTAMTGFVASVWQLAAARVLMGAGEAAGQPPSNSMIADLFATRHRARALAIFGTAFMISSVFLTPVAGHIGQTRGWRDMFTIAGIPGLVLAVVFALTVREPARSGPQPANASAATPGFWTTARFLARSPAFIFCLAGVVLMGANIFAASQWSFTFLARVHHMSMAETAATIGPIRGILGGAGVLAGGWAVGALIKRDPRWRTRLPAITCLLVAPAELMFLLADDNTVWLTGLGLASFFTYIHQPIIYALVLDLAKPRMRAVATAILLVFASLLSQAVGPVAVGALNDLLAPTHGELAIRYSLLLLAVTAVGGGIMFWCAGRHAEKDVARASA
jgi:MFS family permease